MTIVELYHPYVGMIRIRLRGYHLSRQLTAPLDIRLQKYCISR